MARIVSTGKTLSSAEYQEKKKEERKKKLIIWGSCGIIFLTFFILVARFESLMVSEIKVSGAQVITSDEVSRNILETLSGKYLWLVPKANAGLLPRNEVKNNLTREFPRFSSVEFALEGPKVLSVSVVERKPFALYCPTALRPDDASACYFLDAEGFIFDEAPAFSGVVYFVYALQTPLEEPKGKQFLETKEFQNLSTFIEALSQLGFEPLALELGKREINLFLQNETKILLSRKDDLAILYSNLESFLNTPNIKKDPNFIEKVKILDLRTENKVFYRFHE